MKAILALLVTVSAFSAYATSSIYGDARKSGNSVTCSITNNSEGTLDLKWVEFGVTYLGRHGDDGQVRKLINASVGSGETFTAKVSAPYAHTVDYCRFYPSKHSHTSADEGVQPL